MSPTVRMVVTPECNWIRALVFARLLNRRRPIRLRPSFVTSAAVDSFTRNGGSGSPLENRWAWALIKPGTRKCSRPSTSRYPGGAGVSAAGPTRSIVPLAPTTTS